MRDDGEIGGAERRPATARVLAAVYLPFACGFFFSYMLRMVNAVIAPNLVHDVGLDAADLGLLTSAYFLTFAIAQLPVGVLLDRAGPRRVQSSLYVCAGLGAFMFSVGESLEVLTFARALIGLGCAGGLMAGLKAIALWFPRDKLALANASYLMIGGLGALAATAPVEALLQVMEWRGLFVAMGAATVAVSALIFIAVPEREGDTAPSSLGEQLRGLLTVYRDPLFQRIAPFAALAAGTSMAVQSLWAGPWLGDIAGLDRAGVASHLLVMALALTAGLLTAGVLANLGQRLGFKITSVMAASGAVFLAAQAAVMLEWTWLGYGLWAAYAFFGSMASLMFTVNARHFPPSMVGRANSGVNVVTFATAFAAQYVIGAVIDLWPPSAGGGYANVGYQAGFGVVFTLQAMALLWFVWPRRRR